MSGSVTTLPDAIKAKFIEGLRDGLSVKQAAAAAHTNPRLLYSVRKHDEEFAKAWAQAFDATAGVRLRAHGERARHSALSRNSVTTGPIADAADRQDILIAELAKSASLAKACKTAGLSYATVLRWRYADSGFEQRVREAIEHGIDLMEDEAKRRGIDGIDRPVYYQGEVVGYVTEYSDALLINMLKMKRYSMPDVNINNFGVPGGSTLPNKQAIDLSKLNDEELMWLERIMNKALVIVTVGSDDYKLLEHQSVVEGQARDVTSPVD